MSYIQLLPFQIRASELITKRYLELCNDVHRPYENKNWPTPFYQALSAITGSGKTAILADTVTQLRASMGMEPFVLWISKGKAIVDQTFKNFSAGGKYAHLIENFVVGYLSNLTFDIISDATHPHIALATVGTFNQKDRAQGTLRIHQSEDDSASDSLWNLLKNRRVSPEKSRPLIIVYDEGHNLSDQQTDLLLELQPDVILVASATMKTPGKLGILIERLRHYGWSDSKLVTTIPSKEVVEAGLIKRQLVLGGYTTVFEATLNDMLNNMATVTAKSDELLTGFTPKAIYVCRTNISQEDGTLDNAMRPFSERKAPPILIWRYLVEQKGIPPSDIAVYCDLKFDRKNNPPPEDFILFSGGEEDFGTFSKGNYHHIIFNLSLQEGWDDPACCFAYIDKSMGSTIQVEQIIGRVLRQPNAQHYPDPQLNTAHFYIRVDDNQVFPQVLETVRKKIAAVVPEIKIDGYTNSRERQRIKLGPKKVLTIPQIHINSDKAVKPLQTIVARLHDYRNDVNGNTIGKGNLETAIQKIGDGSSPILKTEERPHSNRVTARWLVNRAIQSLYPEVIKTIDWSDDKFKARVEINSVAADALREAGGKLVNAYLEHSELVFEEENPYSVGLAINNSSKQIETFVNSLHDGYTDLNRLELEFAREIDKTGFAWVRNPSNGGFSIPLLETGGSRNFYPDFLVWKDNIIYALDPKGGHLVQKDAGLKLLSIRDENNNERILVRFFTHDENNNQYKVWELKSGKTKATSYNSIKEAVEAALGI